MTSVASTEGEAKGQQQQQQHDVEQRAASLQQLADQGVELVQSLVAIADVHLQAQLKEAFESSNNEVLNEQTRKKGRKKGALEANSVEENDELVVRRLLEAQHLLQRMAMDGRLTMRGWKYWLLEEAERRRQLEEFETFQRQQIDLAVKAESHKNLSEIRERRVHLSEMQLNLQRLRERLHEAEQERARLADDIHRTEQLRTIVNTRVSTEGDTTAAVEERLQNAQEALSAAIKQQREAQGTWDDTVAHANKEQRAHADMIKDAESQLSRAQQLLQQEEAADHAPDDRTDELKAKVAKRITEQQHIRQQVQEALRAKEQIRETVSALQEKVEQEQAAAEERAAQYEAALRDSSSEHERMDRAMAEQRAALERAQGVLADDAGKLHAADDALFNEEQVVRATEAAITSAETGKAALEAEMQRIEGQYKLALDEYDRTMREVTHHRQQVQELKETMALDDRALKHRCREMEEDLAVEKDLHAHVQAALQQVNETHARVREDTATVLPKLEADISATDTRVAQLEERKEALSTEYERTTAREKQLRAEHAALQTQTDCEEQRLAGIEAEATQRRDDVQAECLAARARVESAPARQAEATETLERLQTDAAAVAAHTEELVEEIGVREGEVAETRARAKQLATETTAMRERTAMLERMMEEGTERHEKRVEELLEETSSVKKDTRRIVLSNDPVVRDFLKEQQLSFGARQTMAAAIARELDVEMQVQRQREALSQQQQLAYSRTVYALLERHKQQLATSMQLTKQAAEQSDVAATSARVTP